MYRLRTHRHVPRTCSQGSLSEPFIHVPGTGLNYRQLPKAVGYPRSADGDFLAQPESFDSLILPTFATIGIKLPDIDSYTLVHEWRSNESSVQATQSRFIPHHHEMRCRSTWHFSITAVKCRDRQTQIPESDETFTTPHADVDGREQDGGMYGCQDKC